MKINKAELQNALEKVKPGLANKEMIEQSTSFAFMNGKVITYNDEISISHPVGGLEITGAIKAQELYQFLGKIKQEEIDITWDEGQFRITAGKSKAGLVLQNEVCLPIEEVGKIGKWKALPDNFIKGLKFCHSSCSRDMSRPILTCVHIRRDGNIESSDGYRVTSFDLAATLPIKQLLIPATSVNELVKYNIKQIADGENWVHFKTEEGTVFSCRVFEDNYPQNIDDILQVDGRKIRLPKRLGEALDRAGVFAKREFDSDSEVLVKLENGQMTISAQADSGWFEETIRIKYNDEPVSFQAHPTFLAQMLVHVQECILGEDRMRFEGENWIHVVALAEATE